MISKNKLKWIKSLEKKKGRKEEGLFVAEGTKLVGELLATYSPRYVVAVERWYTPERRALITNAETEMVTDEELTRISFLQHPQEVLALFSLPEEKNNTLAKIAEKELVLALDGVQDPGNMGTIVRLADWFGIEHIFCSRETVDVYNPKALQATMGAIGRVNVHYVDLIGELTSFKGKIYGTHLDGKNIYEQELTDNGVIVMGNEGNGISTGVSQLVNSRLYIPTYPSNREAVESLNVAVATAIVCGEFRRRM